MRRTCFDHAAIAFLLTFAFGCIDTSAINRPGMRDAAANPQDAGTAESRDAATVPILHWRKVGRGVAGLAMATSGSTVISFGGSDSNGYRNETRQWDGIDWKTPSSQISPPRRAGHAMATLGQKVILFGGLKEIGALNDTWEWDGSTWTPLSPATSPPARFGHAMATIGDKVILFGGTTGAVALDDTWEWDGSTWTHIFPTTSPPARDGHAMATLGIKVVLFGGAASGAPLADTWEWSGTTWTHLATGTDQPQPRFGHAMATLGNTVVLFGGIGAIDSYDGFWDTWEWDGRAWTLRVSPLSMPPGRADCCASRWARRTPSMATLGAGVVLVGEDSGKLGGTWGWNGESWRQLSGLPVTASNHAMATLGNKVILFGGVGDRGITSDDTWEWDGIRWTHLFPATSPPARSGHAMATLGNRIVMFGGSGATGITSSLDDTWTWDGITWTQLTPATSPLARSDHDMATLGNRVVMFGGSVAGRPPSDPPLDDTWEWDGVNWTQLAPRASPTGRSSHAMATLADRIVMFGGSSLGPGPPITWFTDSWEWDGITWTQLTPATSPLARGGHAMTTLGHKVVMFGGSGAGGYLEDTWEWDGITWKQVGLSGPPTRSGHAMATLGDKVVLFGGRGIFVDPADTGNVPDMWQWDGTTWTQLAPAARPLPRRGGHTMSTLAHKVVLFGGDGFVGFPTRIDPLGDTWEWDGEVWIRLAAPAGPSARLGQAMATRGDKIILFGGFGTAGPLGDTWQWDGTTWTRLETVAAPPPRGGHAMATLGEKVVLFGGATSVFLDEYRFQGVLHDTWEWNGTTWTQIEPPVSPPARGGHAMATLGDAVVLFAGYGSTGPLGDTWQWDGTTWVQRDPSDNPAARSGHAMATLGNKIVLFAGADVRDDTWEWDGTGWSQIEGAAGPPGRVGHAMATLDNAIVLFGGRASDKLLDGTWLFGMAVQTR